MLPLALKANSWKPLFEKAAPYNTQRISSITSAILVIEFSQNKGPPISRTGQKAKERPF